MAGVGAKTAASLARAATTNIPFSTARCYATSIPAKAHHRIVVVGGGTAGVTVAAQILRANQLEKTDIAVLDPASTHHYQVQDSPCIPLGEVC